MNLSNQSVSRILGALAIAGALYYGSVQPAQADDDAEVYGTIVGVRANILDIRPNLRPRTVRVALGDKTVIMEEKLTKQENAKVGMRVSAGGAYSEKDGFKPRWVEVADAPIGFMAEKTDGLKIQEKVWARAGGTLKSLKPFVITDDKGKDMTVDISGVKSYWRLGIIDKTMLLIGVRVDASGPKAADGVIQATGIYPDRNFAQFGAMFGTIKSVHGDTIEVQPRYRTDTILVTKKTGCSIQREVQHDPDSVKIGDMVTFWGFQHHAPWETHKSDDLTAVELLIGKGRNPAAATSGDNPPVFLTGKLASLTPAVQLALPGGKRINVTIPAQMPVVSIKAASMSDLKPGTEAMLVLSRNSAGDFEASAITLDAPPWVGYGQ